MFKRVLVANRGEVAARIIRAAKKLGVETVAVYSTADADSSHLEDADVRVNIGGSQSKDSYLNIRAILQTALQYDCQAVHPGWGFLAENALFARLCEQQKTTFIGPPSDVISLNARQCATTSEHEGGKAFLETLHVSLFLKV